MADRIKPCPFCGSKAKLHANGKPWPGAGVECSKIDCLCIGKQYIAGTKSAAVRAAVEWWNRRAPRKR